MKKDLVGIYGFKVRVTSDYAINRALHEKIA